MAEFKIGDKVKPAIWFLATEHPNSKLQTELGTIISVDKAPLHYTVVFPSYKNGAPMQWHSENLELVHSVLEIGTRIRHPDVNTTGTITKIEKHKKGNLYRIEWDGALIAEKHSEDDIRTYYDVILETDSEVQPEPISAVYEWLSLK